jgi:hypothetical protein
VELLSELLRSESGAATEEHGVSLTNQPSDSPCTIGGPKHGGPRNPPQRAAGINPCVGLYEDDIGDTYDVGMDDCGGSNLGGELGLLY